MNADKKEAQRGYQETLQRFLEALDARNDIDPREPWTTGIHRALGRVAAASLWHGGDAPHTNTPYVEGQLLFLRTALMSTETLKELAAFIKIDQEHWSKIPPEPEPKWYMVMCSERVVSACIVKAPSEEVLEEAIRRMTIPVEDYSKLYDEDWGSEGYEEGSAQKARDQAARFGLPILELSEAGDIISRTENA